MTVTQLECFRAVARRRHFARAADSLGKTQPALTVHVQRLEADLGVRLLERTTRRLALTAAGRLLYPHARRVSEECDAARATIAKLHAPATGPLRIVSDPIYGRLLLTPLVPRFLECFPDIPLEVALDGVVTEGGWDVAISARPVEDPAIAHRSLGAPPAVLCATPAYLERRGTPVRPEDLRGHDLLTPEPDELPEFRLLLSRGAQRAEVPVSPKLAVADPAVLHAAAAAGLGIGLLPGFLCRQGLATGRLKIVLPEWTPPPAAALHALYPAALEADTRVRRFIDFLAASVIPALIG